MSPKLLNKTSRLSQWIYALFVMALSFVLWQWSLSVWLLPLLAQLSEVGVNMLFSGWYADSQWLAEQQVLKTRVPIFIASQAWPEGSVHPDISLNSETAIYIKAIFTYTLGLPLFWSLGLILARGKYLSLLWGSLLLLLAAWVNLLLISGLKLFSLLQGEHVFRLLSPDKVIGIPAIPEPWLLELIGAFVQGYTYFTIGVLPGLLLYYFHYRQQWPIGHPVPE